MIQRSVELFAAVDRVLALHEDWQRGTADYPDQDYWDAVDSLVGVFNDGALPRECRDMARIVEAIRDKVREYDMGGRWQASKWSNMLSDLKTFRDRDIPRTDFKRIESITELAEGSNPVPYWQIAKMYGLTDPKTGEPLRELAEQEHRRPGSVLGKRYPHPDQERLDYAQEFLAAYAGYGALHGARQAATPEQQLAKAQAEKPYCPESWEELFALKPPVSIEQLKAMKGATEEEVYQEARRCGSVEHLPLREQQLAQAARATAERARKEKARAEDQQAVATALENDNGEDPSVNSSGSADGPSALSIEAQIIHLAGVDGKTAEEIKELTGHSLQKIRGVIKAHQAKRVQASAPTTEPATV